MTAGLPATGIGGLFYILLVLFMPFQELYLTLRGRSTLARWRTVAVHTLLAGSIVAALWAEAWGLRKGFVWLAGRTGTAPSGWLMNALANRSVVPALALSPFLLLGALFLAMHVARIATRRPPGAAEAKPQCPMVPRGLPAEAESP